MVIISRRCSKLAGWAGLSALAVPSSKSKRFAPEESDESSCKAEVAIARWALVGGLYEASRTCSFVGGADGHAACLELRVCRIWKDEEEEEKACRAARKVEREGITKAGELIRAGRGGCSRMRGARKQGLGILI